jgi:hypothetical protein
MPNYALNLQQTRFARAAANAAKQAGQTSAVSAAYRANPGAFPRNSVAFESTLRGLRNRMTPENIAGAVRAPIELIPSSQPEAHPKSATVLHSTTKPGNALNNAQTSKTLMQSSTAKSRVRWNNINGSGPVSNAAFLARWSNDHPQNHDWVFHNPLA